MTDARTAGDSSYRALFDSVSELVYVQEVDTGRFVEVNEAVLRAYGYSRREIIGSTPELLADPERVDLEATREAFGKAVAGAPQRFEWWGRRKDGTTFPKEVSITRGTFAGRPAIIAVGRDITHRQEAEAALRRSEQRYRELFLNDLAGTFAARPDGSLESCNLAFCRIAGHDSVEEALTLGLRPLWTDGSLFDELVAELAQSGRVESREAELRRPDGSIVRVLLHARAISEGDDLRGFHGHCLDITRQRARTERAHEARKMEAVSVLAGGVAHDLNNALTAIYGHAGLLLESSLPDDIRAGLDDIASAADHARRLIRRLLTFSRRRVLRPRAVDLADLVRGSADLVRRVLGEEIAVDLVLGETGRVRVDPGEMEQALLNLVRNAREALPSGGNVTIRVMDRPPAGCTEVHDQLHAGRCAVLQVADDGIGMDPRIRARAFEPFFTTHPEPGGRGLGLAAVYGVARDAGGGAWLESEPGQGTTVSVCLPCVPAPELGAGTGSRPRRSAAARVLLAEDEESVRRVVRKVLEREGLEVVEAADGQEALQLARAVQAPFDGLVTDVVMPRLRGTDLAQELRALDPDLPVLYMSGYTESDAVRDEGLGPISAFLDKPFTPDQLRDAILRLLRGERSE